MASVDKAEHEPGPENTLLPATKQEAALDSAPIRVEIEAQVPSLARPKPPIARPESPAPAPHPVQHGDAPVPGPSKPAAASEVAGAQADPRQPAAPRAARDADPDTRPAQQGPAAPPSSTAGEAEPAAPLPKLARPARAVAQAPQGGRAATTAHAKELKASGERGLATVVRALRGGLLLDWDGLKGAPPCNAASGFVLVSGA